MKMRRSSGLILLTLFCGIFHMNTFAQVQVQINTPISIIVPPVLNLYITAGGATSFNFNTINALDNGLTLSNATTLTYSANQSFYITINSQNTTFSGGGSPAMPASVVQYRLNGGSTYTALSSKAAPLVASSGSKKTPGTSTIGIDFFVNPFYTYPPATNYSITIVYTISNQ